MKPLYMKDILNYEYPVSTLNSTTSQDCSEDSFFPEDLVRDFYEWRSNTTEQFDIYFEISESDALNCFALIGTNLTSKSQVYLSGSNTSGIGGFSSPTFTKSLTKKNDKWILYNSSSFPACQYYKLTIIANDSTLSYVQIKRVLAGKAQAFPIHLLDGYTNGKESYQKRSIQAGQWRPGSENSMLNVYDIEFNPVFGNKNISNNDQSVINEMNSFIEEVRTTTPFLFILNPNKPEDLFDYVVIDGETIDVSIDDNGTYNYSFTFKELK